MRTNPRFLQRLGLAATVLGAVLAANAQTQSPARPANGASVPIPPDQIGLIAGQQYHSDDLSVARVPGGARLNCVFQRLAGEVTPDGLWLVSTTANSKDGKFRVAARAVGRAGDAAVRALPPAGQVAMDGASARFIRSGLTEEYSASVDGVRQDFIVEQRPACKGRLRLELAVDGAKAEPLHDGVRLTLADGRKLAYHDLRASDSRGRELLARMEVMAAGRLVVSVDDTAAVYPVRIDPTFSDADWSSLGGVPGANGNVYAIAVDGSGNVFIGGDFTVVGNVAANGISEWNGSAWSALGTGVSGTSYPMVRALAVSGTNLYVGGSFTNAGGVAANCIAMWDGANWSAPGSGMTGPPGTYDVVFALAASGGNLYAGGSFTNAGGTAANYIAQWDGTNWSPLGSGLNSFVSALVVWGSTNLFVGGAFTNAGGAVANRVAEWNGSTWSALGTGMNNTVWSLALSGVYLYAGGAFTSAGGSGTNRIAAWNGTDWSALGTGMNSTVYALAVSGPNLYAGGDFTSAGGTATNRIAIWNGSVWSSLSSGTDNPVLALKVFSSTIYAGGEFGNAGGAAANSIAQWNGSAWSALRFGHERGGQCGGGVRHESLRGRRVHNGAGWDAGQLHRPMERQRVVGARFGDERPGQRAGGVRLEPLCRRRVHECGRDAGQLHRPMERQRMVGSWLGNE